MKTALRKKTGLVLTLLALAAATMTVVYARKDAAAAVVVAAPVTRGSIVSVVSATGTLEAVTTVQVGSQVSGTVESLSADFNSIVRKGQVVARLEQSLYLSAIEQARANVIRAEADLERIRVSLSDADVKLNRAQELSNRQLIAANELDSAQVARDTAAAQVRSSQAALSQAQASLAQAQVNLSKTVITSPIDGIVISRNVDVGQTVAASLSAPTLFVIAADLTRMRLNASIDEADLGRISQGQHVTFTVDAYPQETFAGRVEQVRLNPVVANNVVTYAAIISAPNSELKLKPGMTASLNVEVTRRDDVLRAPAAALRFKPAADVVKALNAKAPAPGKTAPGEATVWIYNAGSATPTRVTTGASDGTWTELVNAPVAEGTQLVTRVDFTGGTAQSTTTPAQTGNPLMGGAPQRRR